VRGAVLKASNRAEAELSTSSKWGRLGGPVGVSFVSVSHIYEYVRLLLLATCFVRVIKLNNF